MGEILFVMPNSKAPFPENDRVLLSKYYDVDTLEFGWSKKSLIKSFMTILRLFKKIKNSGVSYTWFASEHSKWMVRISRLLRKQSIVVIAGGEVAGLETESLSYGSMLNKKTAKTVRYILRNASKIIAVSDFSQKEILKVCEKANTVVVHNGVDTEKYRMNPDYEPREPSVLTVSIITPMNFYRKGLDVFFKVAERLPDVKFVLAGKIIDYEFSEYMQYICPENVIWKPNLKERALIDLYQKSRVYCQLSLYESFGISLAEAMACGCIPIVKPNGALPEVVGEDGYYATNIDEIVTKISNALNDFSPNTSKIYRERVIQRFDEKDRMDKITRIINNLLSKNKDHSNRFYLMKLSIDFADMDGNDTEILDLGSNDCVLRTLLPKNVNYTGIDIIDYEHNIVHDLEKGLPVLNKKFDIIFMNQFIEHIENFKSLLIECRKVLKDDGKIIINTPSNNRILYGDYYDTISEHEDHIHCIRKTNMRNLARICGYELDKVSGSYIRFPPLLDRFVLIPTRQTVYSELLLYRLRQPRGDDN